MMARRWIGALPLLMSLLLLGCNPGADTLAPKEAAPVKAKPLALLVLTPGMLSHKPPAPACADRISYQPSSAPSLTPPPSPTTAVPSPTSTPTPPAPTLTPTPPRTASPTPSPTAPIPTSSRAATPPPRPPADLPPDRIVASAIGLDAPVVEVGWHLIDRNGQMVSEWDTAEGAAGFHRGSSYPGRVGNTVLSGHHNIKGEVFRHLIELRPGDLVSLYVGKQEYRYTVQQVLLIPEENVSPEQRRRNARWIGHFPDERLTLVTCWPYTDNTHRVIVIAYPPGEGP
ncbi:MAG: sortase [Chloroflexota bacterium]|nr:sortase [Chloroflexota bacterium]